MEQVFAANQQSSTQGALWMKSGKLLLGESSRIEQTHGECIGYRQLKHRAGGGSQRQRARLSQRRNLDDDI